MSHANYAEELVQVVQNRTEATSLKHKADAEKAFLESLKRGLLKGEMIVDRFFHVDDELNEVRINLDEVENYIQKHRYEILLTDNLDSVTGVRTPKILGRPEPGSPRMN